MVALGTFRERYVTTALNGLAAAKASRPSLVLCACAFTMVCSLLLGGATEGGYLSDAVLELLAIPALLLVVSSLIDALRRNNQVPRSTRWALMLCLVIALVPLAQLIPLPPWLWTRLPGREAVVATFGLVEGQGNWMPISVSPTATWLSLLSLVAPMTIFLGAIQLGYRERRWLSLVVISVGIISAFLGLIQLAQGPTGPLRFFKVTSEALGFFANRNDFAALLYMVLLFAAAWAIEIAFKTLSQGRGSRAVDIVVLTAALLILIVLIATEAMTRSRAGLVLTIAAVAGMFAMPFGERRNASAIGRKLLLGAILVAVILTVQFALYRVMERFALDPMEDARVTFAHNTFGAAIAFLPFGAGVGTFIPVYAMFEQPSDVVLNYYINHAHNDFLEVLLETGLFGVALFGVFMIMLGFRSVELWWRHPDKASELDRLLMRAATLAILLLIVHSFVEYPLRTGAIMAIFAFSCALLVEPFALAVTENAMMMATTRPGRVSVPRKQVESSAKTMMPLISTKVSSAVEAQNAQISEPLPRLPGGRWGEEIEWPAEWQNAKAQKPRDVSSQSGGADMATVTTEATTKAPSQSGGARPATATTTEAAKKTPSQIAGVGRGTVTTEPAKNK
jgi:O-antigen ligase